MGSKAYKLALRQAAELAISFLPAARVGKGISVAIKAGLNSQSARALVKALAKKKS